MLHIHYPSNFSNNCVRKDSFIFPILYMENLRLREDGLPELSTEVFHIAKFELRTP